MEEVRRRFFLGVAAVISAAAACFPSFSGLDDGTSSTLPIQDAQTPPGDDGAPIEPIVEDSGAFDVVLPDGPDATLPYALDCNDAKKRGAMFDQIVTIDPDGLGPTKPFDVYCKDMATTPKEYLTLVNTTTPTAANAESSGSNVSSFAMGTTMNFTCACPPDEVRAFTRVRLKIAVPFYIVTSDTTWSSTNRPGDAYNACELSATTGTCNALEHPQRNYGVGSSCVGDPQMAEGRGNVDLRGTPFHINAGEQGFGYGYMPFGTVQYLTDDAGLRKQAEIHGGGRCGGYTAGSNPTAKNVDVLFVDRDPN